ncbi:MAG: DUF192 domain-containing protein [Rhodoferax sp.]|jgi:uncharacterized membrane protein (UPF0127 family)|nr:DUF192 domain-containing protein [Rhodoferax sp.]
MENYCLHAGERLLTTQLRVCCNFIECAAGVLWRPSLDAECGEALLIPCCCAVHTFWQSCGIDVIFLDKDRRIIRICSDVRPWRVVGHRQARFALECAVGTAWTQDLQEGQQLHWRPLTPDMRGISAGRRYGR